MVYLQRLVMVLALGITVPAILGCGGAGGGDTAEDNPPEPGDWEPTLGGMNEMINEQDAGPGGAGPGGQDQ